MKVIRNLLKKFILLIVKKKYYYISALILRLFIRERLANGKNKIVFSRSNNRVTILALDADRYRGDLEILASVSEYRVLNIRQKWQGLFLNQIYGGIYNISLDCRYNSISGDKSYKDIVLAKEFTNQVLGRLFSIMSVNCVTTVNYRYVEDLDWTLGAVELGIPYIMLYRECLVHKGNRFYDDLINRHSKYKFHGSHIIVHNQTCKSMFVESNYCKEENISVIGALRMDKYLKEINNINIINNKIKKRKRFVLFYFPYDMSLFGKNGNPPRNYKYKYAFSIWEGRKKLFKDIHTAIVELAIENPEIDFVIKPKDIMMKVKSWGFYNQVLYEKGFNINNVSNYSVEPYANVHNLILGSDVICALQSSTVIESAISGKPVILPVFTKYRKTDNFNDFTWKNYLDIFNVANDKGHLKKLIMHLMENQYVGDDILNKRKKVFKSFFNDTRGESLYKYVKTINNVIGNRL